MTAGSIFVADGLELTDLPADLVSRPGWSDWSRTGDVRLWHHATDADEPFSIFARQGEGSIGFHFGTHAAASERRRMMCDPGPDGHGGFVLAVVVRHARPLRLADKYCWDMDQVTCDLVEKGVIDEALEDEILGSCDTQALFAALEAAGYDSILYANETEGGEDGRQDSILVWRAAQIRSVHARSFVEGDPRLCPSLSPTPEEWQWWKENERGIDQWLLHFGSSQARGPCRRA